MNNKVIAAVRDEETFEKALNSKVDVLFFLSPSIDRLSDLALMTHKKGKQLFIHIDLTSGLGKDLKGIEFAKSSGVDGIISTRANLIKFANECGLSTVQRVFMVDSRSIDTTMDVIKSSKPDMIEAMPGICEKIIKTLCKKTSTPIIAGGFIESKAEVDSAIKNGAYAISTSNQTLWDI